MRRCGQKAYRGSSCGGATAYLLLGELTDGVAENNVARRRRALQLDLPLRRASHSHDQIGGVGKHGVVSAPWVELELVGGGAQLRLERVEQRVAEVADRDGVAHLRQVLGDLLNGTRVELRQVDLQVAQKALGRRLVEAVTRGVNFHDEDWNAEFVRLRNSNPVCGTSGHCRSKKN
eukprot:6184640-Pleurochrysis_carterae.AAC.3